MPPTVTANQLRGRATGALFFTGFGAIWLALALFARQQLVGPAGAAILLGTAILATVALRLKQRAARFSRVSDDPAIGRVFGYINAIQWIAIAAVIFLFARLHIDAYVLSAITAIIGLHMFPLARLFRYPPHFATGAALTAWATISIFVAPAGELQSTTAIGTGVLLWTSAAITLALAFRLIHRA